jgi:integrase
MPAAVTPTGHLQVKPRTGRRSYYAYWTDADGLHGKRLGLAHVKDSGRRTKRNATIWRAGDGPKPSPDHLTPKEARAALDEILAAAPRVPAEVPTSHNLRDALEQSTEQRIRDGLLKRSTIGNHDAINERLCRDLGGDTPVAKLSERALRRYFENLEAHRCVSAATAAKRAEQGARVRETATLCWTVQPASSVPVEVATKAEAVRVASDLGGRWKHTAPGVYRVTPPNAVRAKRVRRLEGLRLQQAGWIMRPRTTKRWVVVEAADPQTRNKYRDHLSAALDYAVREGWLPTNPVTGVSRASLRSVRVEILRREDFYVKAEVKLLLAQVVDPLERAFFELGFDHGLRLPGEGLGLHWGSVDFAAKVIRPYDNLVDGEVDEAKTLDPTAIPMSARTERDLRAIKRRGYLTGDGDPVFVDETGRLIPAKKLRRVFVAAARRAGLKLIPMYNCRHSFGTALARGGVDVRTIQALMRHTKISTTQKYMAYAPQEDLAARMASALEPPATVETLPGDAPLSHDPIKALLLALGDEIPPKWLREVQRVAEEGHLLGHEPSDASPLAEPLVAAA